MTRRIRLLPRRKRDPLKDAAAPASPPRMAPVMTNASSRLMLAALSSVLAACAMPSGAPRGTMEGEVTGALAHPVRGAGLSCRNDPNFTLVLDDTAGGMKLVVFWESRNSPAPGTYPIASFEKRAPGRFQVVTEKRTRAGEEEYRVEERDGTVTFARVDSARVVGRIRLGFGAERAFEDLHDFMSDSTPPPPQGPSPGVFTARFDVPWGACPAPDAA